MKKSLLTVCLGCIVISASLAQASEPILELPTIDSVAIDYANTITEADLNNYLSILASDALEGRDTGARGQKMAAAFIREHFKDNKLVPIVKKGSDSLYFQSMDLYRNYFEEVYIEAVDQKYQHMEEVVFLGDASLPDRTTFNLQFVGDGEEADYAGLEVEDALVAFLAPSLEERQRKIKIAKKQGAVGFLAINADDRDEFNMFLSKYGNYFRSASITKEKKEAGNNIMFFTNLEVLSELLSVSIEKLQNAQKKADEGSKRPYKKLNNEVSLKIEKVSEKFETENVLGLVEGDDKKDELIVITAHYDHVGKDGDNIYNGADDDASGTAAVMELAQAFALAKENGHGPRRSLLFLTVTGEEKGLLGSDYYASNPVWPLSKTITNLNIDMIGRVDPIHKNKDEYVYIIGSDRLSLELHVINEQVNKLYTGLELDYKYNDPDDPNRFYYRSDHYNFAKHGIPIIFYFNGTHDDYHQPTDTIEKIRFDLLKKRSDLIFYCAWELANREDRIKMIEQ